MPVDGARYGKGARVAGGYVVAAVTERYMILERPDSDVAAAAPAEVAYFIFDG